jgi:hypothetical protein
MPLHSLSIPPDPFPIEIRSRFDRLAHSGPLRIENERLGLEKANAQHRADIRALAVPWWRQLPWVASITAILAGTVPLTAAIDGSYQKERELALSAAKQEHEFYTSYLERAGQPGARLRTLRFVMATTRDESLRDWAASELVIAEKEIAQANEELKIITSQLLDEGATPEQKKDAEERRKRIEEVLRTLSCRDQLLPSSHWARLTPGTTFIGKDSRCPVLTAA